MPVARVGVVYLLFSPQVSRKAMYNDVGEMQSSVRLLRS